MFTGAITGSTIDETTGWIYYKEDPVSRPAKNLTMVNGKLRMTDVISAGINYDTQVIVEYSTKNQPHMYVSSDGKSKNFKRYKSNLDIQQGDQYFLCLTLDKKKETLGKNAKYVLCVSDQIDQMDEDFVLCAMFQQFLSSTEVMVHIWSPTNFQNFTVSP